MTRRGQDSRAYKSRPELEQTVWSWMLEKKELCRELLADDGP